MPRIKTPQTSSFPFHITARTPNKVPFPIPLDELWQIFEDQLFYAHHLNGLKIHQFVLMPNHFHLVATAAETPIGVVMNYLMREVSKTINIRAGKVNQNFGDRHYRTLVTSNHYAMNVYKYVYQNPLRAHLCRYSEAWPWSTLHGITGLKRLSIPLEPDVLLFNPLFEQAILDWVNTESRSEVLSELRRYLTKGVMKAMTDRATGRPSILENQLI